MSSIIITIAFSVLVVLIGTYFETNIILSISDITQGKEIEIDKNMTFTCKQTEESKRIMQLENEIMTIKERGRK
jgi:hypothetical protein